MLSKYLTPDQPAVNYQNLITITLNESLHDNLFSINYKGFFLLNGEISAWDAADNSDSDDMGLLDDDNDDETLEVETKHDNILGEMVEMGEMGEIGAGV